MKVLHVIHSADPEGGGPIEGVKQLGTVLQQRAHMVEVLCLDSLEAEWLAEFPLKVHAVGPSYLGYGYTPRLIPWLRKHHSAYDSLIVNGLWQFNGLGTWLALRGSGLCPYFVFPHGMLDPWFRKRYPFKHLKKSLYWPIAEHRILRDAAAVLFTCEQERLQARRSFFRHQYQETVVNYGTAGPIGDPDLQRSLFLSQFPQLRDGRLLLFLGRFHEKKGCLELIEAFRRVITQNPSASADLHLVMAGPLQSEYGHEVQQAIGKAGLADRVVCTGMLTGDLKWGAFRAAEVFILPSHQENFGIAVAEALACSVPVLISDKVNIWREIEEDGAGFVEDDDVPGTVRLLERWNGASSETRAAMRLAARESFQRRFEIERAAQTLIDTIERVVDAPTRR